MTVNRVSEKRVTLLPAEIIRSYQRHQSFRSQKLVTELHGNRPPERARRDGISAGVTDGRRFYGISATRVRAGGNLESAGLVGAGRTGWLKRCAVQTTVNAGRMLFNGEEISSLTTQQRLQLILSHLPEDRQSHPGLYL